MDNTELKRRIMGFDVLLKHGSPEWAVYRDMKKDILDMLDSREPRKPLKCVCCDKSLTHIWEKINNILRWDPEKGKYIRELVDIDGLCPNCEAYVDLFDIGVE